MTPAQRTHSSPSRSDEIIRHSYDEYNFDDGGIGVDYGDLPVSPTPNPTGRQGHLQGSPLQSAGTSNRIENADEDVQIYWGELSSGCLKLIRVDNDTFVLEHWNGDIVVGMKYKVTSTSLLLFGTVAW